MIANFFFVFFNLSSKKNNCPLEDIIAKLSKQRKTASQWKMSSLGRGCYIFISIIGGFTDTLGIRNS